MLKVFLGFVVSVVVLLLSAYVSQVVPRVYAASASVLITHIQAGGVGAATQEFVVLYNNSPDEVDISGWCLTNKGGAVITCFTPPLGQALYLPAYKHAVAMSTTLANVTSSETATAIYTPVSQSSGSITGGSDTVSLIDHTGALVDRQAWTTSLAGGMQFERHGAGDPLLYQDTDTAADWSITLPGVLPADETELDTTIFDVCPNIEDIQLTLPVGKELNALGECIDQVIIRIEITEVLPNAVGSDTGNEFIEIYNPNDFDVDLKNYSLYVGPQLSDSYSFPTDTVLSAYSYKSFTNSAIDFNLLNTSSKVLLALKNGIVVSEVLPYQSPKEGQSWAFIDGIWQYTDYPTPGRENVFLIDEVLEDALSVAKPCAVNQYRSLDTNRCRLLSTLGVAVTPCKDGQYRSEETNRCRNIASDVKTITPCDEDETRNLETNRCRKIVAAATPAPCKAGQERSPDTNRCRTVTKMSDVGYGVLAAEAKGGGNWYVWAAVGGVLLLAISYAIWEWHVEVGKFLRTRYFKVLRFARLHK